MKKNNRNGNKDKFNKKPRSSNTGSGRGQTRFENARDDRKGNYNDKKDFPGSFDALKSNDINWWNKVPYIYDQAVKIPFNRILGDVYKATSDPDAYNTAYTRPPAAQLSIPGIMTVDFTPTIGTCVSPTDAVNLAFDRIYSYIYQMYTGAANFTKADISFQILHEVSIASLIACAKRMLRSLFSFSQVNHNFPRLMYQACGGDAANFTNDVQNYPALVKRLNQLILSFNSLYTPYVSEVFDRWYSLCNNVWLDDEDVASQMFLFRPTGYYTFEEAHDDGSGNLIPATMKYVGFQTFNSTNPAIGVSSVSSYLDAAEALLGSIRNTSYFGIVNASIAKAFPANKLLTIDPYLDGEIISPIFSRNMNWQLNNLITEDWGIDQYSASSAQLDITEDVTRNILFCEPKVNNACIHNFPRLDQFVLNSYDGTTDPEFIMEATRLVALPMVHGSSVSPSSYYTNGLPLICGTEIPGKLQMYYITKRYDSTGDSWMAYASSPAFYTSVYYNEDSTLGGHYEWSSSTGYYEQNFLAQLSKFRNAPRLYVKYYGDRADLSGGLTLTPLTKPRAIVVDTIGDVYKFTLYNGEGLQGLHDAARLSIFTALIESMK